jgi:hypothetical protein
MSTAATITTKLTAVNSPIAVALLTREPGLYWLSLRQHVLSRPGAGIDARLIVLRIVDANVLASDRVHTHAACSQTNTLVPLEITVQLCSWREAAALIALKQAIQFGRVFARKRIRPNGHFRFHCKGLILSGRWRWEQHGRDD